MVKKIFTVLGTVVAAVVVIAFVLNVLMPNTVAGISNAVEGAIYNATQISFDLNGDGIQGKNNASGEYNAEVNAGNEQALDGVGVDGFN